MKKLVFWTHMLLSSIALAMEIPKHEILSFSITRMNFEDVIKDSIETGNLDLVKSKLDTGIDVNAIYSNYGNINLNALTNAASQGSTKLVELLLARNANPNGSEHITMTPLHHASCNGYFEIVKLLLGAGADINAQDIHGITSLLYATTRGHKKIVQLLLMNGADANLADSDGWAPLHRALSGRKQEIRELLLLHGADINVKNKKGKTPLFIASKDNQIEAFNFLLEKGATLSDLNLEPAKKAKEKCLYCASKGADYSTACNHKFHKTCLIFWLEKMANTCPECRNDIIL